MKKSFVLTFVLVIIFGVFSHASALSPPKDIAYQKLIHAIGLDSRVKIDKPVENDEGITITIHATTEDLFGASLKLILKEEIESTKIILLDMNDSEIIVPDITITPEVIKYAMEIVFASNQYIHSIALKGVTSEVAAVFLITEMASIQFYTDDMAQYYQRSTYTAQDLFSMIIKNRIENTNIFFNTRLYYSPYPDM